jgi:mRNA interferase MazF
VSRKGAYVPERGAAVRITLDPQAGHEQAGRRPALVLSPSAYNGRVGLALFCPITTEVNDLSRRRLFQHGGRTTP